MQNARSQKHTDVMTQMYVQHHDWLVHWLYHRVKGQHYSAADIVQDVFLKILKMKTDFIGIQEPRAYLVNMSKNICIDHYRRDLLEQAYLSSLEFIDEDQSCTVHFEETIHLLDFFTVALSGTTQTTQMAFIFYYIEGYTQTEIAQKMGKSLRTIQYALAESLSLCYQEKDRWVGI